MTVLIYFVVGGVSFVMNFVTFGLLVYVAGVHWVPANFAGFFVGTLINYFLSAQFVFARTLYARQRIEILLTVLVSAVGVGAETLLLYVGHDVIGLGLAIAKVGAAGVVFFWNYLTRRYFIFGAARAFSDQHVS